MICGWDCSCCLIRNRICHRHWFWGTFLIPPLTAVLIRSIQALSYTFLLYYILPIKTAVCTLLTTMNMWSLLNKVIALLASFTAISIWQFCAVNSHYLVRHTFMTVLTGSWVICIWEFSRRTGFAFNFLCWGYDTSTYWNQSQSRMTCVTR